MHIHERLREIMPDTAVMRNVEPHIYSFFPEHTVASYDRFGGIYDVVACNRIYNKLVWGYSLSEYQHLCADALQSSQDEWVLDAGCGSLAFTGKTYMQHQGRPVVLLDRSVRMLKLAKTRIIKLNGTVPETLLFVQGDIAHLPFRDKSICTIIALNVLHAVDDAKGMLGELRRVMGEGGSISLTTLVKNKRIADWYIDKLGERECLMPRSFTQLLHVLENIALPVQYLLKGNLAIVNHGRNLKYFQGIAPVQAADGS
ncbi:MAG: class I SAM-dependent methyltransferase [Nitrospirota bacterium]